jgi:hypothetical protein
MKKYFVRVFKYDLPKTETDGKGSIIVLEYVRHDFHSETMIYMVAAALFAAENVVRVEVRNEKNELLQELKQ